MLCVQFQKWVSLCRSAKVVDTINSLRLSQGARGGSSPNNAVAGELYICANASDSRADTSVFAAQACRPSQTCTGSRILVHIVSRPKLYEGGLCVLYMLSELRLTGVPWHRGGKRCRKPRASAHASARAKLGFEALQIKQDDIRN